MSNLVPVSTSLAAPVPAPAAALARLAPQPAEAVTSKTWLAVAGAMMGAFLSILNIQVVNSSLADIQGAIGAGIDTGGWISTSYLIAEIIVIPLSGWLAQAFSVRLYLMASAALFLLFSAACAFAQNLTEMIIFRAFQGFAGGVLIPLALTIVVTLLPKPKQPVGLALFALATTFAPAIGPTIGGWLNDRMGWQYIFYFNLVPGLLMLGMLGVSLPPAPMKLSVLKQGDWPGIATMALGLGTLQTMLEEGNRNDWFGSPMITGLAAISAISLTAFLWIELRVKNPLVNLRLLADRNFGVGTMAAAIFGFLAYGSIFVLPLYLSQVQGYDAMQIGEVLAWTGLPQLVLIPFLPALLRRFDFKLLLMLGFGLFGVSNLMNVFLSRDVAGDQLLLPNIVRAIGQSFIITPLTAVTTARLAAKDAASGSALFNMMRNLGGAIGIAVLQTFVTKREQFHSNIITRQVSLFDADAAARLHGLTHYFQAHGMADPAAALHEAAIAVGRSIRGQATIMAYGDAFALLGAVALVAALVSMLLRKTAPGAGGAASAH